MRGLGQPSVGLYLVCLPLPPAKRVVERTLKRTLSLIYIIYIVYFALADIIYNRYIIYDKDMCMYNETIESFIGPGIDSHEMAVTKFGEMKRNDVAPRAHGPSMQHSPSLTYISADNH